MNNYVKLDVKQGSKKPNTIINKKSNCTMCDFPKFIEQHTLLMSREKMLLVENKFPSLSNTYQTVLIENDSCEQNISNYNKDHLFKLINFLSFLGENTPTSKNGVSRWGMNRFFSFYVLQSQDNIR